MQVTEGWARCVPIWQAQEPCKALKPTLTKPQYISMQPEINRTLQILLPSQAHSNSMWSARQVASPLPGWGKPTKLPPGEQSLLMTCALPSGTIQVILTLSPSPSWLVRGTHWHHCTHIKFEWSSRHMPTLNWHADEELSKQEADEHNTLCMSPIDIPCGLWKTPQVYQVQTLGRN